MQSIAEWRSMHGVEQVSQLELVLTRIRASSRAAFGL
jgi:hypothetical protein